MLERLVPDLHEREAFGCGPPPTMKAWSARFARSGWANRESIMSDSR